MRCIFWCVANPSYRQLCTFFRHMKTKSSAFLLRHSFFSLAIRMRLLFRALICWCEHFAVSFGWASRIGWMAHCPSHLITINSFNREKKLNMFRIGAEVALTISKPFTIPNERVFYSTLLRTYISNPNGKFVNRLFFLSNHRVLCSSELWFK